MYNENVDKQVAHNVECHRRKSSTKKSKNTREKFIILFISFPFFHLYVSQLIASQLSLFRRIKKSKNGKSTQNIQTTTVTATTSTSILCYFSSFTEKNTHSTLADFINWKSETCCFLVALIFISMMMSLLFCE